MTELTPQAVQELVLACLYSDPPPEEPPEDAIIVKGIVRTFGFDPAKVADNKPRIAALLAELPTEFRADGGGGWTFLNACQTKDGKQWTGLHATMEELVCLGIAAGYAKWQLPREVWAALPGGMPYLEINLP